MNFSNLQPRQRRFLLEYVSFDLFWSFIGVQEKLKIVQDSWNSVQFYEQFEYTCKYHSILWISKFPNILSELLLDQKERKTSKWIISIIWFIKTNYVKALDWSQNGDVKIRKQNSWVLHKCTHNYHKRT